MSYKLLSFSNPKIQKSNKVYQDYLTAILHLHPINTKICPYQDVAGCKEACLNTAGRGGIIKKGETTNVIQEARKRKTNLYLEDKETFMSYLITDIQKFVRYCEKKDKLPCIRLNGTSDIQWENYKIFDYKNIFESFPDVQFYDYTKIPTRKVSEYKNYHLTWSYSEANMKYANLFDKIAYNIAVVFNGDMPIYFKGREVVNGDESDLRFLDKGNVIVGLKAKGKAKKDTSGFVIQTA
eukprot:GHVU01166860.1.p1 GENE.GHVU01166860.1~~GHVU01166860.1.p1  ORF type:complete len:238 (-),score=23.40 GHVU01166860.1:1737-2450(-)